MAKVLGLDPGTRRCGVAVSDSLRTMAFPRTAFEVSDTLVARIAELVDEESIELVVVGRPVALSGRETASTGVADRFVAALAAALAEVTVVTWDERLTTTEAQRSLTGAGLKVKQHRRRIDSAAAVVMLQSYLEGTA